MLKKDTDPLKQSLKQSLLTFAQWYATKAGRRVFAVERRLIHQALQDHYWNVRHTLQLSVLPNKSLLNYKPRGTCQRPPYYDLHPFTTATGPNVIGHFEQLAFATECIDIAILHHAQELAADPHELLRDIQRVIVPQGRVIIVGFNPWSWSGGLQQIKRAYGRYFAWNAVQYRQLISAQRLVDWLSLLGFRVHTLHYGFDPMAVKSQNRSANRWMHALTHKKSWHNLWQYRCCYVITAIKDIAAPTSVKKRWVLAAKPLGTAAATLKTNP